MGLGLKLAWRRATAPSTGGEAARRLLKEVLEYPGGGVCLPRTTTAHTSTSARRRFTAMRERVERVEAWEAGGLCVDAALLFLALSGCRVI